MQSVVAPACVSAPLITLCKLIFVGERQKTSAPSSGAARGFRPERAVELEGASRLHDHRLARKPGRAALVDWPQMDLSRRFGRAGGRASTRSQSDR